MSIPPMLINITNCNHFILLSVDFTLVGGGEGGGGGHKESNNENLMALFSCTLFD